MRRSAGAPRRSPRPRPREDRLLQQCLARVPHAARRLLLGPLEDLLASAERAAAGSARAAGRRRTATACGCLKLVNTLLDFSRIEAGRVQAVYEPTDLAAYTADLASVFRSLMRARPGLRSWWIARRSRLRAPVYVDREMWEKIVLNLLSNAFKYTFEGEITVSLGGAGGAASS